MLNFLNEGTWQTFGVRVDACRQKSIIHIFKKGIENAKLNKIAVNSGILFGILEQFIC